MISSHYMVLFISCAPWSSYLYQTLKVNTNSPVGFPSLEPTGGSWLEPPASTTGFPVCSPLQAWFQNLVSWPNNIKVAKGTGKNTWKLACVGYAVSVRARSGSFHVNASLCWVMIRLLSWKSCLQPSVMSEKCDSGGLLPTGWSPSGGSRPRYQPNASERSSSSPSSCCKESSTGSG